MNILLRPVWPAAAGPVDPKRPQPPGRPRLFPCLVAGVLWCAGTGRALTSQTETQTFELHPGWNAIYLEVAPANPATSAVFAGIPVDSVWTFQSQLSSVQFIQDPKEPVWNKSRWAMYVPTNRVESFQNNLFSVQANRAYLVNLGGSGAATFQVTGRPSLHRADWVPDAYNLRGFPVDSVAPPTFLAFFGPSSAHYDSTAGHLQPIYRLSASGEWNPVNPGDAMQRGEAYWVYTRGPSDYQAPLEVEVDNGDSLDFGVEVGSLNLKLSNLTGATKFVAIQDAVSPADNALSYSQFNPTNGIQWPHLLGNPPAPYSVTVGPGQTVTMRLGVRRGDFTGDRYETLLEVTDGEGGRVAVPVSANKVVDGVLPTLQRLSGARRGVTLQAGARRLAGSDDVPLNHVGLWVGTASINAVSEGHSGSLTTNVITDPITGAPSQEVVRRGENLTPTPTATAFNLRLLVHVDTNGVARLLKEVIQLWQDGTYTNDNQGRQVLDRPGHSVLVTDDALIGQFKGATLRDGRPVGRRISSVDFDFPSTHTNNFLPLIGSFAIGNTLSNTIVIPPDLPTNPFRHKYHPDHDNLDASFKQFKAEAYEVRRAIELQFSDRDPAGKATPGYGYDVIAGRYRETVSGLHKTNIVAQGNFRLQRVLPIGLLNQ